jgi:hypothetical protein
MVWVSKPLISSSDNTFSDTAPWSLVFIAFRSVSLKMNRLFDPAEIYRKGVGTRACCSSFAGHLFGHRRDCTASVNNCMQEVSGE